MDRFVKGFIVMSIVYMGVSALLGVFMLWHEDLRLKFVHSHLNMLGWVSMMIFGVGYHVLPRFAGRLLYSNRLGETQFYLANISLAGLLISYSFNAYNPSAGYRTLAVGFGAVQVASLFLFFYNMLMTLLARPEKAE